MLDGSERFQKSTDMASREISGEMILVPVRSKFGDLGSIFTMNDTAAFVWARLDGVQTLADIRDALVEEFEVEPQDAEQDLLELLEQLQEMGAIAQG